jgi:hypothetical protein
MTATTGLEISSSPNVRRMRARAVAAPSIDGSAGQPLAAPEEGPTLWQQSVMETW